MANAAALIWETLPDVNWVGFYRNVGGELVLGPFQGRPACIRMTFGEGVCGAAAETPAGPASRGRPRLPRPHRLRQRVEQRDRRAAVRDGELIGVLDIDSPKDGAVHRRR